MDVLAERADLDQLMFSFLDWVQPCVEVMDRYLCTDDDRYIELLEWLAAQPRDGLETTFDRHLRSVTSTLATGVELMRFEAAEAEDGSETAVEEDSPHDPATLTSLVVPLLGLVVQRIAAVVAPMNEDSIDSLLEHARGARNESDRSSRERNLSSVVWNLVWLAAGRSGSSS